MGNEANLLAKEGKHGRLSIERCIILVCAIEAHEVAQDPRYSRPPLKLRLAIESRERERESVCVCVCVCVCVTVSVGVSVSVSE